MAQNLLDFPINIIRDIDLGKIGNWDMDFRKIKFGFWTAIWIINSFYYGTQFHYHYCEVNSEKVFLRKILHTDQSRG